MAATVFECSRGPEGKNCSVKIVGEHDDVVRAAHDHLVSTHGLSGGDDLKGDVSQAVAEHQVTYKIWGN